MGVQRVFEQARHGGKMDRVMSSHLLLNSPQQPEKKKKRLYENNRFWNENKIK
jgi:hypothetical protein